MKRLSNSVIFWIIRGVAIVLLLVGAWLGWGWIEEQKVKVHTSEQNVLRFPELASKAASLQSDLDRHRVDIERLWAWVPERNGLADIIQELEEEASRFKVNATVSDVAEKPTFDENGNKIEPVGPFVDVEVDILAEGDPVALLRFLHAIEHMPYLVYMEEWTLDGKSTTLPGQVAAVPDDEEVLLSVPSKLTVTMVVAVRNVPSDIAQ